MVRMLLLSNSTAPTLDSLARDIERVESIREIKDVQRTFAQFAQFARWNDMAALFAHNGTLRWGNETATGLTEIASWLRTDAGNMDGVKPGSLDTLIAETPVVTLSVDGQTAKGRWNGLRFMGDGAGATRIQGGIYENQYVRTEAGWRISLLHYHAIYAGTHEKGWRNIAANLPIIPYHFTPDESGVPVPPAVGDAPQTSATVEELRRRVARMHDEDEVRNLMHAHGYYVDRRMWTDVVDMHTTNLTTTVRITNDKTFVGLGGVREALQRMGPEGLTQGINNDHPIFDLVVDVHASGTEAVARGIEIAMLGDANNGSASWEFNVLWNTFAKEDGRWKVKDVEITPLVVADYYKGWGRGGLKPPNTYMPPFLNVTGLRAHAIKSKPSRRGTANKQTDLTDLQRRLARSAAYDGAEAQSHAYGYFLDDLQCALMGSLFAARGHKASPFAGFFLTPSRINEACYTSWGRNRTATRTSISFHWRPQPVVLVSPDGRSATLRARLLQPNTAAAKPGSFNSAIYHDQMVLEGGKWRLWSVTIDEFYWQSASWEGGWAAAKRRNASEPDPPPAGWVERYPPDVSMKGVGEREATFRGGVGSYEFGEWEGAGILLAGVCAV
ncbi:hypothetical protein BDV95DRAFT_676748 [Massariosphaeria phaeospora]|uniref:SnoaL-like domain-containing protein n=1 Tax=Massariosphaeria phaeospora TaxID=100035 RepID=A0A7C8IB58_9PLEO|nr:hypothetical protein BDV95DRAFT_676748 [Massariosphaeria phaeospora]